jgi:hypothetical protein
MLREGAAFAAAAGSGSVAAETGVGLRGSGVGGGQGGGVSAVWEEEVMAFLETAPGVFYDPEQALVLVELARLTRARLFFYDQLHIGSATLAHFMESRDSRGVLRTARAIADKSEPGAGVWRRVLQYFAEASAELGPAEAEAAGYWAGLQDVLALHYPAATGLAGPAGGGGPVPQVLPPLQVLETLSANPRLPLAVVAPYVAACLDAELRGLAGNRLKLASLRAETAAMEREIGELRSGARVFKATRCAACSLQLELPALHFLCGHSFHQSCVPESELGSVECVHCARTQNHWESIAAEQRRKADQHEQFYRALENPGVDGFSVVADFFGKGVFTRRDVS